MTPDERFHGHVSKVEGQIPWVWSVYDRKKRANVAWGEEFDPPTAFGECSKAVAGARWWHWYRRKS